MSLLRSRLPAILKKQSWEILTVLPQAVLLLSAKAGSPLCMAVPEWQILLFSGSMPAPGGWRYCSLQHALPSHGLVSLLHSGQWLLGMSCFGEGAVFPVHHAVRALRSCSVQEVPRKQAGQRKLQEEAWMPNWVVPLWSWGSSSEKTWAHNFIPLGGVVSVIHKDESWSDNKA